HRQILPACSVAAVRVLILAPQGPIRHPLPRSVSGALSGPPRLGVNWVIADAHGPSPPGDSYRQGGGPLPVRSILITVRMRQAPCPGRADDRPQARVGCAAAAQ